MDVANPPPKEDIWAFGPIGSPFPDNPVHALGQSNMYVALWYKHGKPVHGRAWNNGGVIECSFPYKKAELTGIKDLGGQIQVLQYKGDHNSLGFWYEWIKYKDRFEKADQRQMLKCGDSLPILWKDRKEGAILGCLDNSTEFAQFSHDGITETLEGHALDNMWIIVRNTRGGPPTCECKNCYRPPPPPPPTLGGMGGEGGAGGIGGYGGSGGAGAGVGGVGTEAGLGGAAGLSGPLPPRVMIDEWMDIRAGDPWPDRKLMKALNRTLDTIPGENPDQYVALWYQQGEPIMGRVWNDNGKVAAAFGWFGKEYREKVGSLQVLVELADYVRGFDYKWVPFSECGHFGEKEWTPVYVDYHKGIISPAVLNWQGKEILGKADIRNERVSSAFYGKENVIDGPQAHTQMVLCRKPRPGYNFD